MRIIINLKDGSDNRILAIRAAGHLIEHPEKADALMEYENGVRMWVRRNKASISVWEQG